MGFPIAAREFGTKSVIQGFTLAQVDTELIAASVTKRFKLAGIAISTDSASGEIILKWSDGRVIYRTRVNKGFDLDFGQLGASPDLITSDVNEALQFSAPANTSIVLEFFELLATA